MASAVQTPPGRARRTVPVAATLHVPKPDVRFDAPDPFNHDDAGPTPIDDHDDDDDHVVYSDIDDAAYSDIDDDDADSVIEDGDDVACRAPRYIAASVSPPKALPQAHLPSRPHPHPRLHPQSAAPPPPPLAASRPTPPRRIGHGDRFTGPPWHGGTGPTARPPVAGVTSATAAAVRTASPSPSPSPSRTGATPASTTARRRPRPPRAGVAPPSAGVVFRVPHGQRLETSGQIRADDARRGAYRAFCREQHARARAVAQSLRRKQGKRAAQPPSLSLRRRIWHSRWWKVTPGQPIGWTFVAPTPPAKPTAPPTLAQHVAAEHAAIRRERSKRAPDLSRLVARHVGVLRRLAAGTLPLAPDRGLPLGGLTRGVCSTRHGPGPANAYRAVRPDGSAAGGFTTSPLHVVALLETVETWRRFGHHEAAWDVLQLAVKHVDVLYRETPGPLHGLPTRHLRALIAGGKAPKPSDGVNHLLVLDRRIRELSNEIMLERYRAYLDQA